MCFKNQISNRQNRVGKKSFDVTDFVMKTKLTELENKIPDVNGLATKTVLTAVENKIPNKNQL